MWHVAHMGEKTGAYRILVGRYGVRRPLGRPRWKDNIKMDLKKWDGGGGGVGMVLFCLGRKRGGGSWGWGSDPLGL